MKKIIIAISAVLLIVAGCTKKNFDKTLLYGTWASGTLHEKYLSNGSGYTWDLADSVYEADAQTFTWQLDGDQLTQYHQMESSSAVVPKLYTITTLTETTLIYEANGK